MSKTSLDKSKIRFLLLEGVHQNAVDTLKAAGYTELHGIEADDDGWEGEGMKQDGKKYEFKIDGRTGEVTKDKED